MAIKQWRTGPGELSENGVAPPPGGFSEHNTGKWALRLILLSALPLAAVAYARLHSAPGSGGPVSRV